MSLRRREFTAGAIAAAAAGDAWAQKFDLVAIERERVLRAADRYLAEKPVTVTASHSLRSAGGVHDFFSEADYWWPDPDHPDGPYIQRDGMTNPDNFVEHRRAMVRLSLIVPALAAAYKITRDRKYAQHAAVHLRAWFVHDGTRMNPNLQYAQAIKGVNTGRGVGIIDTLHLVEVARAASRVGLPASDLSAVKSWFAAYTEWMNTHPYGIAERDAKNNHGTCWVAQVAEFSELTGNAKFTAYCRDRFQAVLIPNQEKEDGSFPEELRRTKPYGYSIFNLDALAIIAQTLDLWKWKLPDGRGMARAMEYMYPFLLDKKKWPLAPDVMYDKEWPIAQPSLLFAGLAFNRPEYLTLWRKLDHDSTVEEVLRNYPVRQPLLWVG